MMTQTKLLNPTKGVMALVALSLAGAALAAPAQAQGGRYNSAPVYSNNNHNNGHMYKQRNQYAWLNRVNRYGVRGKIVKLGRGQYRDCFRVKRTGRYHGEQAIVTVRYCQDHYGQARMERGSKYLVRYLNAYRPANGYSYRTQRAY